MAGRLNQLQHQSDDALYYLGDAFDDCDAEAVASLVPRLQYLKARADALAQAARKSAQYSTIDATEPEEISSSLKRAIEDSQRTLSYCAVFGPVLAFPKPFIEVPEHKAPAANPPNLQPQFPGGLTPERISALQMREKASALAKAYDDAAARCDRDRMAQIQRELDVLDLDASILLPFASADVAPLLKEVQAAAAAARARVTANCPSGKKFEGTGYVSPYAPEYPSVVPPPTAPLGGRPPFYYCTEQQRIDDLLKLQEELIHTDGTTRQGRARQEELQRDIKRAKEAKLQPCGNTAPNQPERPLPKINLPLGEPPQEQPAPPKKGERPKTPATTPPRLETPSRFPPPTAPLGGRPRFYYCTEQQRIDDLLKLQEELIHTDGTTREGRARQEELQRDIKRAKEAKLQPCGNVGEAVPQTPRTATIPLRPAYAPPMRLAQAGNNIPGVPQDPWTELKLEAWDLFVDLDDAIYLCDADEIAKLIPELEDLAKRARQVAQAAKAAGKFSKIDPAEAQKLADSIQDALNEAKSYKACPAPKETTTTPKTAPGKPGQPRKPEGKRPPKSDLNDLFKPEEKPTPPKHSIVEDIREAPTPVELHAIEDRIKELAKLTDTYRNFLEGCQPDLWDKHIAHLEDLAKRARQMAEDAKRGYTNGVTAADAERVADEAQKAVDEAKRQKAANLEKWRQPNCPKITPQPKSGKTEGYRVPGQPSPYENVGTTGAGPYTGGLGPRTPAPQPQNAKQEYDAITASIGGLGFAFYYSGERNGCDAQQMQAYIAKLEEFKARAQRLAEALRQGGEYSTLSPATAQQLADNIQRYIDEARQVSTVDCPAGVRFKMSPWDGKILAIINRDRAAVGVRPLHWDPVLAAHADSYAQQLARLGQLVHAERQGRGIERENLGQGRAGETPDQIVQREWSSEQRYFRAGIFPNICDGDWTKCAHHSQDIWPTTTDIGCGYANGGGFVWIDCRFSPGGNKDNQPVGYRDPLTYLGGPLQFNPTYSPVLKAMRPVNPDKLEFGDEAVAEWRTFEYARGRCSVPGMSAAIDKLKYYAQAAHEHSAEEHMKGNELASGSYDAMAKQIDERVQDASLYRDACARNPYQPERG